MWWNNKQEALHFVYDKLNTLEKELKQAIAVNKEMSNQNKILNFRGDDLQSELDCLNRQKRDLTFENKKFEDKLKNGDALTDNEFTVWKLVYQTAYEQGFSHGLELNMKSKVKEQK